MDTEKWEERRSLVMSPLLPAPYGVRHILSMSSDLDKQLLPLWFQL
jgi:hypothetical protein